MNAWRCNATRCWRTIAVVAAGAVLTASFAARTAAAPFPAQHFSLTSVGGESLQKGFVEVIHPDGPEVYARHVYALNGAGGNQSYEVVISIWASSPTCVETPTFVLPVAVVDTNASGNGHANVVFEPELLDTLGLRDLTVGGTVTLSRDGSPAYTTGCRVMELD